MSNKKAKTSRRKRTRRSEPTNIETDNSADYQTIVYINPLSPSLDFFKFHFDNITNIIVVSSNYEETSESIMDAVKRKKLCNNIVLESKIASSLDQADFILTKTKMSVNSQGEVSEKIVGFATAILMEETSVSLKKNMFLYIDVFCGHKHYAKVGTDMMTNLKSIGNTIGVKKIKLHSITEALGFYTKIGFECDPTCKISWDI